MSDDLQTWRAFWCTLILYIAVGVLVGWLWTVARGDHLPGLDKYRGVDGVSCCGDQDCQAAAIQVYALDIVQDRALVAVNGTLLELSAKAVHMSPSQDTYWCWKNGWVTDDGRAFWDTRPPEPPTAERTRCVFFSQGA